MNPLSSWTFCRRHKRRTALLLALIGLGTLGLYLMGGLIAATFLAPQGSLSAYLAHFSIVQPARGNELNPGIVAQIRAHPDVAHVLPQGDVTIDYPSLVGAEYDFRLLALQEDDIPTIMTQSGLVLKEGRLLKSSTSEVMLSEEIATTLDLKVGDRIGQAIHNDRYENIIAPMEVVGILSGDVRIGLISYEYLSSHELYHDQASFGAVVIAQGGSETAVDQFLVDEIQSKRTRVNTFGLLNEELAEAYRTLYLILGPISAMVAIVISLVIGIANRIAFTQRLPEFGILHANGYSKRWLTRRLTLETSVLAGIGWVIGIGLSWLALYVLKLVVYAPQGYDLQVIQWTLVPFVALIPISGIILTVIGVGRILSRLDAVSVVERSELDPKEKPHYRAKASSQRPLALGTFCKRHGRRVRSLVIAMALMTTAVASLVFVFTTMMDAEKVKTEDFGRMSIVAPNTDTPISPGVTAQIRSHPTVERVIPSMRFTPLSIAIPPARAVAYRTYAVSAEDMAYLVELFELTVKEGSLPRPRTNELIISEAVALNRNLKVGDIVGSYENPLYEGAAVLPAELVISGVFARPPSAQNDTWLSLASLEFMDSHEFFPHDEQNQV